MMKNPLRNPLLALLLGLFLASSSCADTRVAHAALEPLSSFPQTTLSILTQDGRQHSVKIWVAATDVHRQQGLMMVKSLATDAGMLFIFDRPQRIQMWMKNTLISLDMLFIDADGRVDSIAANTTPMSLNIIEAKSHVLGVLEMAGGNAAKLGINVGAIVKHPAFASVGGQR
jgi:uncharacterized membrane protein (UPF0127 family)